MTKILIVDDISENRYLLISMFKASGYEVVSAVNGAEALELAQKLPPDLIITDILMPVMDGFELCRRWKMDERLKNIPFVIYTATYTDPKDQRLALGLGAERFVIKPVKPEILMQVVREVLEEVRQRPGSIFEKPLGEEMEVLRQYNEALFRKMEKKVLQLKAEIADRERAQEAFRESQARLLEAHRLAHIGIWSWTPETDAVVWSEELYKIAGIDPHQPAPSYAEHPKLYTPESWQLLAAAVDKALRTAEPYKLELELIRPDGSRRWINAYGGAKRDSSGRIVGLHGTVQDVTETRRSEEARRTLEEKLRVSQKMEAIGSLAGGVAHDFNNVLNIIFGYAQLSLQRLNQNDPLYENIQQIIGAGDRAAGLTRQLLAFSRKQVLQPIVLNLNQIIGEFEMMLRRILGEDIDFILVLAPDLGVVRADPSQIEQVLLNLVVNARDAMSEGGKLTVETSNVEIDQEYAAHHVDTKPGPYVQLAISDTGCGMDDKTRARIFEPFFTTKSNGKGTGLGLSTVYGIVTQSGGNVSVYSEPGRGTTFKIYLPRELSVEATAVGVPTVVSPSTGTETILVVEDESALRKIAKLSLETAGFTVLTAADGDEALQISSRHAGDIQLLLTDVVMPRMTGRGIAQALAKTRPAIKVLYMSGYADAAIVHDGVLDEGTHFISKPFTLTALTRKVREALDGY